MTVDLIAVVSSQTLLVADQRGEGEEILHPEKSWPFAMKKIRWVQNRNQE